MDIMNNIVHLPKLGLGDIIEIIILTIVMYYIGKTLRGTRAWILLKGVFILLAVYAMAYIAQFKVIVIIFQNLILFLGIVVIMVLQPEIRKLIEQIGTNNLNLPISKIISALTSKHTKVVKKLISDQAIQEIVKGTAVMGKAKTGALIVIENTIPLNEFMSTGIPVNADITSQLLINIFEHNTPLHDGAIIIRNNKIISATCYLPLSDSRKITKELGTRHRAGIGITEVSDATVVIVSEETGAISVVREGKLLRNVDREKLTEELKKTQSKYAVEQEKEKPNKLTHNMPLKIGACTATILLWFIVISTTNPITTTVIRNVPVELINTDSIAQIGKTYEVTGGETVSVTVKGRKDELDKLDKEDINVQADFSKLSIVNSINIDAAIPSLPDAEITLSSNTLSVSVEDIVDTEFDIEVNQLNTPGNLYYISGIELSSNTLVISGAKSMVSKIGKVEVDIDTAEITKVTVLSLKPVIYDKNGEVLDTSKFKLNYDTIEASVSLYNTKLVPLNINASINSEQIKYILAGISYTNKSIYVAGSDEDLSKCKSVDINIVLDIPLEEITKSQFIKNIELKDYMHEGIYVTHKYSKESLVVDFKNFFIKTATLQQSDIEVTGIKAEYLGTMQNKAYKINAISLTNDISSLDLKSLQPFIDASGVTVGQNNLGLQFRQIPVDTRIFGETSISINVGNRE